MIEFRTLRTAIPWREWPKLANRVFFTPNSSMNRKNLTPNPLCRGGGKVTGSRSYLRFVNLDMVTLNVDFRWAPFSGAGV